MDNTTLSVLDAARASASDRKAIDAAANRRSAKASRWPHMRALLCVAGHWTLNQIHPDPRERQKIYTYLIISSWVIMCAIGLLAAWGIHP